MDDFPDLLHQLLLMLRLTGVDASPAHEINAAGLNSIHPAYLLGQLGCASCTVKALQAQLVLTHPMPPHHMSACSYEHIRLAVPGSQQEFRTSDASFCRMAFSALERGFFRQ
jgi:hypothetical protein